MNKLTNINFRQPKNVAWSISAIPQSGISLYQVVSSTVLVRLHWQLVQDRKASGQPAHLLLPRKQRRLKKLSNNASLYPQNHFKKVRITN